MCENDDLVRENDVRESDDESMDANDVGGVNGEINCDENVTCCECGLEEVAKEECINGQLMNWVGCTVCERWFHEVCLNSNTILEEFVCKFC